MPYENVLEPETLCIKSILDPVVHHSKSVLKSRDLACSAAIHSKPHWLHASTCSYFFCLLFSHFKGHFKTICKLRFQRTSESPKMTVDLKCRTSSTCM